MLSWFSLLNNVKNQKLHYFHDIMYHVLTFFPHSIYYQSKITDHCIYFCIFSLLWQILECLLYCYIDHRWSFCIHVMGLIWIYRIHFSSLQNNLLGVEASSKCVQKLSSFIYCKNQHPIIEVLIFLYHSYDGSSWKLLFIFCFSKRHWFFIEKIQIIAYSRAYSTAYSLY